MPSMLSGPRRRQVQDLQNHFPSTAFSRQYQTGSNPLQHGAPCSKDEVRAFQRPASEIWISLATVLWLQSALEELPASHPSHAPLRALLDSEPRSPTSTSSASRRSSQSPVFRRPVQFPELPAEVRNRIYSHAAAESSPISPILNESSFAEHARIEPDYFNFGLPALLKVFPSLKAEIRTMLPKFYEANMFQFDLRQDNGTSNLYRWIDDQDDEASAARTISILHYTWYWNSTEHGWSYVTDATVFSLTATGRIKVRRTTGQLDSDGCSCDMNDWFFAQCSDWTANKSWTMPDFVHALREERELLVQAVTKFLDLVQEHDESLHMWRTGPQDCALCSKQMIFFRTFEDVEWTSD